MLTGKTYGRKNRKWLRLLVFGLLAAFLFTGISFAGSGGDSAHESSHEGAAATESHGGGHGDEHHDEGALLDLLARFINFALLVIILAVVLKKSNAFGFFSDRVEDIKKQMEQLRQEKNNAEAKYNEVEAKLKDFEAEKQEILEVARKDGESEKEKIIQEAQHRVAQMMEQVEITIQQELKDAKVRLKREVADLAAEKAQEIISRELNEDDQDRLVNEFIERVGKAN
jgi:F-type H+-transporting ATPase subunit b